MKNSSLYHPGFHLPTLRRKPRSLSQKLADGLAKIQHHSISSLGECFGQFIPSKVLENGGTGSFNRRRVFSKTNTFWAFFSQVLDVDGGCQEVWYNNVHRHSAIRYVTPNQRHRSEDSDVLRQRKAVYTAARKRNPERWSGGTRNWNPVTEVWLNPPKEHQTKKEQDLKAA